MTQEEIIQELFKARVSNRISQVDLGHVTGYNESQIIRTERGKVIPRLQMVCDLADALGLEIVVRPKV